MLVLCHYVSPGADFKSAMAGASMANIDQRYSNMVSLCSHKISYV